MDRFIPLAIPNFEGNEKKYVDDALEQGWAVGWRSRGWKKADKSPALNPDLWERLLELMEYHRVTTVWVKGHAGHPYNERCDQLATEFADRIKEGGADPRTQNI